MGDLFPDTIKEIKPKPRALDLRTEYLKERYNIHAEWVWHSFEAMGDWPTKFALYKGGVYRHAKQSGKYKGTTDYRKPELGTEAAVVLDDDAFAEWLPTWEARTGKCSDCKGTGQQWVGWSRDEGDRLIDCQRCGTTGIAPASGIETGTAKSEALSAKHESPTSQSEGTPNPGQVSRG